MRNKLYIVALSLAILLAAALGASGVLAQDGLGSAASLVDKIATKFNLNKADVQAVFDQDREERHARMEAKYEERLSQYVTDGKITEAQKKLILDKHKELGAAMQADMQSMQDLTPEERKAKMLAKKQELETWAQANGIDMRYVDPFIYRVKGFGMGGAFFEKHID